MRSITNQGNKQSRIRNSPNPANSKYTPLNLSASSDANTTSSPSALGSYVSPPQSVPPPSRPPQQQQQQSTPRLALSSSAGVQQSPPKTSFFPNSAPSGGAAATTSPNKPFMKKTALPTTTTTTPVPPPRLPPKVTPPPPSSSSSSATASAASSSSTTPKPKSHFGFHPQPKPVTPQTPTSRPPAGGFPAQQTARPPNAAAPPFKSAPPAQQPPFRPGNPQQPPKPAQQFPPQRVPPPAGAPRPTPLPRAVPPPSNNANVADLLLKAETIIQGTGSAQEKANQLKEVMKAMAPPTNQLDQQRFNNLQKQYNSFKQDSQFKLEQLTKRVEELQNLVKEKTDQIEELTSKQKSYGGIPMEELEELAELIDQDPIGPDSFASSLGADSEGSLIFEDDNPNNISRSKEKKNKAAAASSPPRGTPSAAATSKGPEASHSSPKSPPKVNAIRHVEKKAMTHVDQKPFMLNRLMENDPNNSIYTLMNARTDSNPGALNTSGIPEVADEEMRKDSKLSMRLIKVLSTSGKANVYIQLLEVLELFIFSSIQGTQFDLVLLSATLNVLQRLLTECTDFRQAVRITKPLPASTPQQYFVDSTKSYELLKNDEKTLPNLSVMINATEYKPILSNDQQSVTFKSVQGKENLKLISIPFIQSINDNAVIIDHYNSIDEISNTFSFHMANPSALVSTGTSSLFPSSMYTGNNTSFSHGSNIPSPTPSSATSASSTSSTAPFMTVEDLIQEWKSKWTGGNIVDTLLLTLMTFASNYSDVDPSYFKVVLTTLKVLSYMSKWCPFVPLQAFKGFVTLGSLLDNLLIRSKLDITIRMGTVELLNSIFQNESILQIARNTEPKHSKRGGDTRLFALIVRLLTTQNLYKGVAVDEVLLFKRQVIRLFLNIVYCHKKKSMDLIGLDSRSAIIPTLTVFLLGELSSLNHYFHYQNSDNLQCLNERVQLIQETIQLLVYFGKNVPNARELLNSVSNDFVAACSQLRSISKQLQQKSKQQSANPAESNGKPAEQLQVEMRAIDAIVKRQETQFERAEEEEQDHHMHDDSNGMHHHYMDSTLHLSAEDDDEVEAADNPEQRTNSELDNKYQIPEFSSDVITFPFNEDVFLFLQQPKSQQK